jgi:hypothetical protein
MNPTEEVMKATANRKVTGLTTVRNIALFLAAPLIGLAYAVAFPFVGAGALVWAAVRAARRPVAA